MFGKGRAGYWTGISGEVIVYITVHHDVVTSPLKFLTLAAVSLSSV